MTIQVLHCRQLPGILSRGRYYRQSSMSMTNGGHISGPKPLVLCGPSGVGKTSIMRMLTDEFQNSFGFSVSHTTRNPRPGEVDGADYHFVSKDTFLKLVEDGAFLEHAGNYGNMYGTSRAAVDKVKQSGKICILDIDVQGVKSIKKTDLNPHFIFVRPQELHHLETRLRSRGTETEESIKKRIAIAASEIEYGTTPGNFDKVIENWIIETAYSELRQYMLPHIEALDVGTNGN